MTDVRIRQWDKRAFYDPEQILSDLRSIERGLADAKIPESVRRLRTGNLKGEREARDAALFAHGMGVAAGTKVYFSPGETEDADFITLYRDGDAAVYAPVQLKELVPADLNANTSLQALISRLAGKPKSDTVLAVRLNRRERIDFMSIDLGAVPFAEVWYFGSNSPDSTRWFLFGNALFEPRFYEFTYPA